MVLLYGDQPDLGPPSCEDAYNIFLSAGNRPAAADAVRLMADGIGAHGHFQQAIEIYQRALNLVEGTGEHLKTGAILNNMAINFANQGKLDRAEELYEQAKLHFELAGDKTNRAAAMVNIADIHFMRGKLALAEQCYRKTLDVMATIDHGDPGYTLYRLADLELTKGNVREALRLAQEAIDSIRPSQGAYQYLTGAMVELGDVLEANGDTASARAQFQQALAIQEKTGALDLAAETRVELAQLAIMEKHPEEAVSLLHDSLAEFEKEKSGPELSGAYILLSRALLMQSKINDARETAHRGADLVTSDPALKLAADIQLARVEMSSTENTAGYTPALTRLRSAITEAHKLGYYNVECEARLALGEIELRQNASLGHKHLAALASETRTRGMELLARQAEGAIASASIVAQNHVGQ
jgi:tetratricopeptide (TPR) repeat protein